MIQIDGKTADIIADYLYNDENKFYGYVSQEWDALTGFFTGAGRYDYQTVVNVLSYFSEMYHDEFEKAEYRKELGIKKKDLSLEMVADIFKRTCLIYGVILADTEFDYLGSIEGVSC